MPIGAIIGAVGQVAGGIAGGKATSRTVRKLREELEKEKQRNADWYNRRYNEDATARADAQDAITRVEEAIRNRNAAAAGRAAVMGGAQDAVIAAQDTGNKALADTASRIAAAGEARKDAVEEAYMSRRDALNAQERELDMRKVDNVAAAAKGLMGAAGSIAAGLSGLSDDTAQDAGITGAVSSPMSEEELKKAREARGY